MRSVVRTAVLLGGAALGVAWPVTSARAWSAGEATGWEAPGAVRAVAVGPWDDGLAVVAAGEEATWVLDGSGAVLAEVPKAAEAAALVDQDGDGTTDLVLCGADGVSWARGTEAGLSEVAPLTDRPCSAIAWYEAGEGARGVVTAAGEATTWTLGPDGALTAPERFAALDGPPLLVANGSRFAVAARGGTQLSERSEWGRSVYTARAPMGGLAAGPRSWSWTLPDQAVVEDVTRKAVPVAAAPTALRAADLDGDGATELVVVHPDALGIVRGDVESLLPLDAPARDVRVADLDGDRCADLLLLGEGAGITVRHGICVVETAEPVMQAGGQAVEVLLDQRDRRVEAFVGHPMRLRFVDPKGEATRFGGRGGPESLVIGEDGLATYIPQPDHLGEWVVSIRLWGGSDIVRVVPIRLVVRPAAEWVATGRAEKDTLRLGETWPTIQVITGETVVLRAVDDIGDATGFAARSGPPGLRMTSDGVITYTAEPDDIGEWEVEVRLTGPGSRRRAGFRLRVAPTAAATAPQGSAAATAAAEAATQRRTRGFFEVRGCVIGVGVAAGATGTQESWENIGRPAYFSFSPVLAGTCEGGPPRGINWFAGADTAPLYAYLLTADDIGVHTLVGTVGISVGSEAFRIGPYAAAGILMTGVGLRMWWLPFSNRAGTEHGFEIRAAYVFASTPSAQAMLMYGWRVGRKR